MTEATPAQTPVGVNSVPDSVQEMFTYGPTKCAVILFDMVKMYDRKHGGNKAHVAVGKALGNMDMVIRMATDNYEAETMRRQKSLNVLVRESRAPFREDLLYETASVQMVYTIGRKLPKMFKEMFKAVATERINKARVAVGVGTPKKNINYVRGDLVEWVKSPIVIAARSKAAKFNWES